MKKYFVMILVVLLMATVLISCSYKEKPKTEGLKDGVYKAEADNFDDKGFKASVEITVKDGKISKVYWDAENEKDKDLSKRKASETGKYDMKVAGAKSDWHEQAAAVEKFLVEKGDIGLLTLDAEGKTDAVAGVSININEFVELAKKALEQAK